MQNDSNHLAINWNGHIGMLNCNLNWNKTKTKRAYIGSKEKITNKKFESGKKLTPGFFKAIFSKLGSIFLLV